MMCHWRKFSIPYSLSWLLFIFFLPHSLSDIIGPLLSSSSLPLISTVHSHHWSLFFLIPGFNQALIKSYTPFPCYSPFSLTSKSDNEWAHLCTQTQKTTQLGRFMVTSLNWERYTLFLFQRSFPLFAPTLSHVFCLLLVFLLIISILKIYSKISNFYLKL